MSAENMVGTGDRVSVSATKGTKGATGSAVGGTFHFECFDKDGNLKWRDSAKNIVTTAGLTDINAQYFKGSGYTAAWYIGLVNASGFTAYLASDTMASHSGWVETTDYSGADRITAQFGTPTTATPSVIDNAVGSGGTVASFSITGTVTVKGALLTSTKAKNTSTGLLFSVASFTAGDRAVIGGDTLNVTYEFSTNNAA